MTKVVDSSFPGCMGIISLKFGKFSAKFIKGFSDKANYLESNISEVTEVDEETYRHGGKAVAGAVIGGVLTGGIGLLAGAAFGGRRRTEGTYLVKFSDGNYVIFKTADKKLASFLQPIILRQRLNLKAPE